ncbi:MAG TPA: DNA polymerase IV [Jatrophihabitantaceae bacterium]|nr:DNA polymerase IV [Mycobacteriales bacterium]HZY76554.1 DNA polymerase IV [Jatrophihabitantaceae bacterium]
MSRRQLERVRPVDLPGDDTGCTILHADMDAFYASVELRRDPSLEGKPVVVGHPGGRSVVLAATYEARAFGVHSAMPMAQAMRRCAGLVVVAPDHAAYAEASKQVMAVFRSVTPQVEPLALDEAFIDVSGAVRRMGSPRRIAVHIRERIAAEQNLPCSIGVAATKFVAKLASSHAKPDGLLVVPKQSTLAFLHPLPVGALWGVGDKTEEALTRIGLRTIGDIAATPVSTLIHTVGKAAGAHLHALANGEDPRRVVADEPDRTIGAEETFARDIADRDGILRELLRLAERCAERLRASGQVGRTVAIKVRFTDFRTISRSRTLSQHTDVAHLIYTTAAQLYDALDIDGTPLRLVGVRMEGLAKAKETPQQLTLTGDSEEWRAAEQAVDRVTSRFGPGAVRPATLVKPPEPE